MDQGWWSFLLDYLVILKEFWWALIPDFALGLWELVGRVSKKRLEVERIWYLRLFVFGLIVAQTVAYKELKGKTDGLYGEIGQVMCGINSITQHTFCLVELTVSNTGNPTYVKNYRLRVKFNDIDKQYIPTAISPGGMSPLNGETGKTALRVMPEDQVAMKTQSPVQTGDEKEGFLLYDINDIDLRSIAVSYVDWEVSFQDIYKHTYTATKIANMSEGIPTHGSMGSVYNFVPPEKNKGPR